MNHRGVIWGVGVFLVLVIIAMVVIGGIKMATPYRLGDVVLLGTSKHGRIARAQANSYPGSIANEYVKRTNDAHAVNISVLDEICNDVCPSEARDDKVLVHIRLGDVLCGDGPAFRERAPPPPEIISRQMTSDAVDEHDLVIVSGNHKKECRAKTKAYLSDLRKKLPTATIRHSEDGSAAKADADFCRMINAKTFYQGKGGYSALAQQVRRHRGLDTNSALMSGNFVA